MFFQFSIRSKLVAVVPGAPKVQRNETAAKEPVRKAEPRPQAPPAPTAPTQPVTAAAPAVAEPARRDAAISDTQWLDAVRQALVTHKEEAPATETATPMPDAAKQPAIPAPALPAARSRPASTAR